MEMGNVDIAAKVAANEKLRTITTWRGHVIDLYDGPTEDQIDILDIAHHQSQICRWGGACDHFYSDAEHSVYVAIMGPPLIRPYLLLHDSPEYAINDFTKPFKNFIRFHTDCYDKLTVKFEKVIMSKFGLSYTKFEQIHLEIKDLDLQVAEYEKRFINPIGNRLPEGHPLFGMPFGMNPKEAEMAFLNVFEECFPDFLP